MKLNGGRSVTGILRGFDPFMNLVVDESIEETKSGEKRSIGMVVSYADLFSLRIWRRKLHIWSPNYTSTLALHKLRKWLRFGYAIVASVIRSSLFDAILFLTRPPCSKGMWARLRYAPMKSCNSDSGFGANIGSERSRNSLQREKMSELKKRAYETSSEEDSVLASKGSATVVKRKKVPSLKFLPAYHEACMCLVPSRKGSELVLCTTCKSSIWL